MSDMQYSATDYTKDLARAFMVMREQVRTLNTSKGWREKDHSLAEYVALLHSEVSEILEEWRNRDLDEMRLEFADVLIRLVDMADVFDIDLSQAYIDKMTKNWKRPYQHGGKTL
jgi:NTP pyrophosphatase (non-canonical NTP hydrolase)